MCEQKKLSTINGILAPKDVPVLIPKTLHGKKIFADVAVKISEIGWLF